MATYQLKGKAFVCSSNHGGDPATMSYLNAPVIQRP
jgi:hypothetical protein